MNANNTKIRELYTARKKAKQTEEAEVDDEWTDYCFGASLLLDTRLNCTYSKRCKRPAEALKILIFFFFSIHTDAPRQKQKTHIRARYLKKPAVYEANMKKYLSGGRYQKATKQQARINNAATRASAGKGQFAKS